MAQKIILVDFAGTLIKAEMIEEANVFRANVLQKSLPTISVNWVSQGEVKGDYDVLKVAELKAIIIA